MKRFYRILAFLMSLIFSMEALPLNIVLANKQTPVSQIVISDYTQKDALDYNIKLNWDKPKNSTASDPSAANKDRDAIHEFSNYDVYYRNSTKKEDYSAIAGSVDSDSSKLSLDLKNLNLQSGSIYSFKAVPYHLHEYLKLVNDEYVTEKRKAPIDTSGEKEKEALYLTDIKVNAKGAGKNLTVTWDNPTFNGQEIFNGYKIFYYTGGSALQPIPENHFVVVNSSNPNLIRKPDGRLEFTINDKELKLGRWYAVKVEPLYNEVLVRTKTSIKIGDADYSIAYKTRSAEYRTDEAYIKPSLYVKEEGLDYIRLYWDTLINDINNIEKLELYKSDDEAFEYKQLMGTLMGKAAKDTNYWIDDKPSNKKYYKFIVYYKDPQTGELHSMESEIREYDPAYSEFEPYKPIVLEVKDNREKPLVLDLLWEVFLRKPYNEVEKGNVLDEFEKLYLDREITYDIWITDEANNLDDPAILGRPLKTIKASDLDTKKFITSAGIKKLGYLYSFDKYLKKSGVGGYDESPVEDNKIYYIKIVATRDLTGEISKPAYASYYIPPIDDINKQPIMISKPPLRIKKDDKGIEEITDKSITIQWDKKWLEGYDKSTLSWYSKIGINSNGNLVFGEDIKKIEDEDKIIYLNDPKYQTNLNFDQSREKIISELVGKGANSIEANMLPIRIQDLKDAEYEISVIKYEDMEKQGGYDEYLKIVSEDTNGSLWKKIAPLGDEENPHFVVDNLESNTAYVIFFRPYYEDENGKKVSYLPNFVMGTTLKKREPIEIVPTVPAIETVSSTDTSVTVKWQYVDELGYDLSISDNLGDYPEGGTKMLWEQIKDFVIIKQEDDKKYLYYTHENLFPDTQYYVWVKSFADNNGAKVYSKWSNPAYVKTLDIIAPNAPLGLGLASNSSISAYNKENNKDYKASDKDYIVVEWLRDLKDTVNQESKVTAKPEDLTEWLNISSIDTSYMAKFNKLIANRDYYIRAKTKLTIRQNQDGSITRYYNYFVELAPNPEFLDAIEIIIPPLTENKEGGKEKSKESEWSITVKLFTKLTDDEYDGNKNPDFFPLPIDDYEITFDDETKTLNYRFRSNKTDASGNKDNMVDQRFISKLVTDKIYDYKLDLTNYKDKKIQNRKIEIPYTIFRSFNENKITFTVISENLKVTIPYDSLETKEFKDLKDFGLTSSVVINFSKSPKNLPALKTINTGLMENYASEPQQLSVQVKTPNKNISLTNLAKDMSIELKLDHRYNVLDNNVQTYFNNGNTVGWEPLKFNYDNVAGNMKVSEKRLGTYTIISRIVPEIKDLEPNIDSYFNVMTKLNITDMPEYHPNQTVNTTQFNNIVSAVVKNNKTVKMNQNLSEEDYNALGRSKLLVSGRYVTKENGISSVLRLYELKTKSGVTNYDGFAKDIVAKADPKYKTNIQKAYKLGLMDYPDINPKDELSFSEFFYMLDFVLSESYE